MRIPLDRESPVPLYQQIEDFLKEKYHLRYFAARYSFAFQPSIGA